MKNRKEYKSGQTRQKLLLAHYNTCKDEIIKKGVEKKMKELILIILALDVITEIFYIRRLQKERDNEEERATTHFKRAYKFERQLIEVKKEYDEQAEILLENASELRAKIKDLENNIEILVNNTTDEKLKELVDLPKSN